MNISKPNRILGGDKICLSKIAIASSLVTMTTIAPARAGTFYENAILADNPIH
jgi:hypothetical protein